MEKLSIISLKINMSVKATVQACVTPCGLLVDKI